MAPGPYNNVPPGAIIHGRRQQHNADYYPYYQHPQQYHPQHAPQYPPQWYPPQYAMPTYQRQYHQMPPQHSPMQHHPMMVPTHSHPPPNIPHQYRPPVVSSSPVTIHPNMPPTHQLPPRPVSISQAREHYPPPAESVGSSDYAVSASVEVPSPLEVAQHFTSPLPTVPDRRMPFYPTLPWLSLPDQPFPLKAPRRRRKNRQISFSQASLQLPSRQTEMQDNLDDDTASLLSHPSTITGNANADTSSVSELHETDSTQPTTPSSVSAVPKAILTPKVPIRAVVPVVPVGPKASPQSKDTPSEAQLTPEKGAVDGSKQKDEVEVSAPVEQTDQKPEPEALPAPRLKPASWADLVRSKAPKSSAVTIATENSTTSVLSLEKSSSLGDIIKAFNVDSDSRFSYLEPRGLVNTGNMCYMNSILQVLLYCIPFYSFLGVVGTKAHNFKSDTPMLDAMIMFMKDFKIVSSAESADALKRRLKDTQLEQYGDQFTPEFVYEAIKQNPKFSNMRRGHQQDAEEFLGILLEALHEECVAVLHSIPHSDINAELKSPTAGSAASVEDGWLEVGPKQKSAITRSTGVTISDSPITKIFGGKLRSELRVPGLKNSVTLEPYRPLQLDIGAHDVHNIVDALKGLTKSETLSGDFNSPKGGKTATKQIFIESLPPVLILHLKRFQYDNTGGVQKIWKKVGYPLELTLPKEVFSPQKRAALAIGGLPRYRLNAVVYHHGKNASGGHYTVDVRRQDGTEWIRLDDTVIRRLRAGDVAEGGAEEDPKVLAKALEQHKRDDTIQGGKNPYEFFENEGEDQDDEGGWSRVNGSAGKDAPSKPKWSAVVNGKSPPGSNGKSTPKRDGFKDNKVAYILFYTKME